MPAVTSAPDPAHHTPGVTPHPSLLVASSFDDTAVRRAFMRGDLVRLVAGRYVRCQHWSAFDAAARHVMLVLAAVSCLQTPVVVSHASAAAFWGLPRLGPWPSRVHVIDPTIATGTTGRYTSRHAGALADEDVCERFGAAVTTATRTAADIAVAAPRRQAIMLLDEALRRHLTSKEAIVAALRRRPNGHGSRKRSRPSRSPTRAPIGPANRSAGS